MEKKVLDGCHERPAGGIETVYAAGQDQYARGVAKKGV